MTNNSTESQDGEIVEYYIQLPGSNEKYNFNDQSLYMKADQDKFNLNKETKIEKESEIGMILSNAKFFFLQSQEDCNAINNYLEELEDQEMGYEVYESACGVGIMVIVSAVEIEEED